MNKLFYVKSSQLNVRQRTRNDAVRKISENLLKFKIEFAKKI